MAVTVELPQEVSHFRLDELLGSGGAGIVYRATDLRLGRRVALKFVKPEMLGDAALRRRLIDEARAASAIDHPNICTIFEAGETEGGVVFIAMAFYEGETLERLITRGPMDMRQALPIAIQTARGLAAAHDELLIHGDIKPANLMIARGGTVKILDFGMARFFPEARHVSGIEGTPFYMSPEQMRGEAVDQRTDIWSLGVVLAEMITGQRPFRGANFAELQRAVSRDDPPSLGAGVPDGLPRILARALAKDRADRYANAEELIHELQALQGNIDSDALTQRRQAAAARLSIAVLPFEDMSPDRSQEHLCDGIAEEILRALGGVPDLRVGSRTSAFQFKHRALDIREIGAKLSVDTVLEGSIRRAGNRLRVAAQLINVADGYRLWYERFDRNMTDIFAIEDEIAERIAGALRVTFLHRRSGRDTPATQAEADAYELYLQGRQFFHHHRRKALEIALQTFSRAIEIDPFYARAYAGIADCHSFLRLYFGEAEASIDAAENASAKALELDPELPEAHAARGLALFVRGELDEAERELQRALELDPRLYDAHYVFGRVCFQRGLHDEAARHYRDACSIVPDAYDPWYFLAMYYRKIGDERRAHAADLECIEAVKKRVRLHADDTRAFTMAAGSLAHVGEPDRAMEWLGRALAVDPDEPVILYNAACVYTNMGRYDEAFAALNICVEKGWLSRSWAEEDSDLDPLRGDARFSALFEPRSRDSASPRESQRSSA